MRHKIWLARLDGETGEAVSEQLVSQGFTTEFVLELPRVFDRGFKPAAIVLRVADIGLPALNALVSAQKATPPIPVIVVVDPDQARIAIEALQLGAAATLVMPIQPADVLSAVRRAINTEDTTRDSKARTDNPRLSSAEAAVFVSSSLKMLDIWNVATRVARSDVPVLILGESGVGKEVLARFIHRHSRRADRPFIKVNCAALPHDLLESELFGYERGAFTGAVNEKPGKFELADKGCILLDEIGEMPPSLQAKLLHVLEDGEFSRLGGKRSVRVDVRVLALTNRKLHEAIPRGEFRDDLYFRLSVVKINIPPLRERKEDIPLLASHFLKRYNDGLESSIEIPPQELIDRLSAYDWPGNVRQLENTIRRYLILPELDMELHPVEAPPAAAPRPIMKAAAAAVGSYSGSSVIPFPRPHESVSLKEIGANAAEHAEREVVLRVLEQTNWNRSHAARRLNICYRALLNKLKKWQISRPRAS
jgi:two-component system response regulator AtoC